MRNNRGYRKKSEIVENLLLYNMIYLYYIIITCITLYIILYNEKYTFMYNDNKYFYYTRQCIIKIFICTYIKEYITKTNIFVICKNSSLIIHRLV